MKSLGEVLLALLVCAIFGVVTGFTGAFMVKGYAMMCSLISC